MSRVAPGGAIGAREIAAGGERAGGSPGRGSAPCSVSGGSKDRDRLAHAHVYVRPRLGEDRQPIL